MISKYIHTVIKQIENSPLIATNDLHTYLDSPKKGYISGIITFLDDSTLTMIEVLTETHYKIVKVKYRYHYMDKNKKPIFRYDDAPHLKDLSSFPHHKHIFANKTEKAMAAPKPSLRQVLDEIADYVYKNLRA
ncbi:MAG: DUF6516 family protein [Candidatus Auribacterota bacterium]|nr:DUF6516 family protein [Candidatus Auribacterota bacterium]